MKIEELSHNYFPDSIRLLFSSIAPEFLRAVKEIHIHKNAPIMLSVQSGNFFISENGVPTKQPCGTTVGERDFAAIVKNISGGSLYCFEETVKNGYIPSPENSGIRIGACGSFTKNGDIYVAKSLDSLCIRIPHEIENAAKELYHLFSGRKTHGILVYSPPGKGKTTVLRDLAKKLSHDGLCVAVADEKGEFSNLPLCHLYIGLPKKVSIELALRNLSPDVIICDEIGGKEEADVICEYVNSGVPFVASAHGNTLEELRRRPQIDRMISQNVFSHAYGITDKSLTEL